MTPARRQRIMDAYDGRCAACGDNEGPFDIDHIHQLAMDGGEEDENLQPLCRDKTECHKRKTRSDAKIRAKVRRIVARKSLMLAKPNKRQIAQKRAEDWRGMP